MQPLTSSPHSFKNVLQAMHENIKNSFPTLPTLGAIYTYIHMYIHVCTARCMSCTCTYVLTNKEL